MSTKNKPDLASKLSLLAIGHVTEEENANLESKIVSSNKNATKESPKKTKKSSVLQLIDPGFVDIDDEEEIDEFFEEAMRELEIGTDDISDLAGNIDFALDLYSDPEANLEYKNDLITAGRKYARTTTQGQGSEVNRAFANQESAIFDLLKDINADKTALDKDLAHLRNLRTKNYKAIAEIHEVKGSLHSTRLQAIKELNSMAKTQFDLKSKMEANQNNDADTLSTRALQNIFSMGRRDMVEASGGKSYIAGGFSEETYDGDFEYTEGRSINTDGSKYATTKVIDGIEYDDDALDEHFSVDDTMDDGDLFLKYEGIFSSYVVAFDEDGNYDIYAEDKDGNVIEDYPLPNKEGLSFTVTKHNNTATDQLQRKYRVKNV